VNTSSNQSGAKPCRPVNLTICPYGSEYAYLASRLTSWVTLGPLVPGGYGLKSLRENWGNLRFLFQFSRKLFSP
jgi:hypothetical protein